MADPNEERERLAEQAMGRDPDDAAPGPDEPWAKTSSGDADEITDDGED